jgi:hypothetical protein
MTESTTQNDSHFSDGACKLARDYLMKFGEDFDPKSDQLRWALKLLEPHAKALQEDERRPGVSGELSQPVHHLDPNAAGLGPEHETPAVERMPPRTRMSGSVRLL